MILAMRSRSGFYRWVLAFAVLGFLIPLAVTFRYGVMGSNSMFGNKLWISSWLLMGIEEPTSGKISTVSQLVFGWSTNVVIYAVLGTCGWLLVWLVRRQLRSGGGRGDR
jgi:hypothetical protein